MQIYYGDGGFDALAYGEAHPNVTQFVDQQRGALSSMISDAGRGFMDYVGGIVDRVTQSEIGQRIQALSGKAASIWNLDTVWPMQTVTDFQHAKSKMRRWIMAEPTVRSMYHRQQVAGYGDQYVDLDPDRIGEAHYDYRRVMDGLVRFDDKDDWVSTTYFEDLREGDRDLTLSEQVSVGITWERLVQHLDTGPSDPTSPLNAAL